MSQLRHEVAYLMPRVVALHVHWLFTGQLLPALPVIRRVKR